MFNPPRGLGPRREQGLGRFTPASLPPPLLRSLSRPGQGCSCGDWGEATGAPPAMPRLVATPSDHQVARPL